MPRDKSTQREAQAKIRQIRTDGSFKPPSLADAEAQNNSIYYSTTQSKLVYKDSGGIVNDLY